MVYVQDKEGRPLMPTERFGKVRRLLDSGMAEVVCRCPFTVRLTYESQRYVQSVTLGVDAGSKHIGLSATTKKKELYSAQCDVRTDVTELLSTRRELRIVRRSRNTRYRAVRFSNRARRDDWIAPSVMCKVDEHLRIIDKVHKILPISKIVIEVAQFDAQKMKEDKINGYEYQQGEKLGFWNVREYVLARDKHECQHCHGKSKDTILNVHHIESRKTGGNSPSNLITLCETCHKAFHSGKIELKFERGISLRDAAFMNIMRLFVYKVLSDKYDAVSCTYGYITKHTRIENKIEKTHSADAFCISGNVDAVRQEEMFLHRFVRRHNRMLHGCKIMKGGKRRSARTTRFVRGFSHLDEIVWQGKQYWVSSRRKNGVFKVVGLHGECIKDNVNCKRITRIRNSGTLLISRVQNTDLAQRGSLRERMMTESH